ncbi:MAG: TIM barrel protein [Nanoarchaeota archaeon]
MIFNTNYATPMDREYEVTIPVNDMPTEMSFESETEAPPDLSVKDIGMSVPLGIAAANPWGIQAKIRSGANAIEIGFPGVFHGQRNAQTPEMYGKEARTAIKEVGQIADVKFTTHAAYGLMGLSGVDQHGNFSWEYQKMGVDEVKKAIDFAADTTGGGSVVVHTGEFERPLVDQPWSYDANGKLMFKRQFYEPYDATYRVIDDRTGQVMSTVQKDRLVARAVWNTADQEYQGVDQNGRQVQIQRGDYIDFEGRKIVDPFDVKRGRVPKFDQNTGRFAVKMWHFDDFVKEAQERNKLKEQKLGHKLTVKDTILPEELYLQATLETQEGHSRGWALQYAQGISRELEQLKKLREMRGYYAEAKKKLPASEQWKLFKTDDTIARYTGGIVPPETKDPVELIDKLIKDTERGVEFAQQASMSQEQQAEDTRETRGHIISAIKRTYEAGLMGYAEAGIHAMERSKNTKEPIFISMENIFPERYGGHPRELKELVTMSRERMVDMLTKKTIPIEIWDTKQQRYVIKQEENNYYQGISRDEAAKRAEQHIKVTFDTGHMNMWRKFWQSDPKKSYEDNQKGFEQWYLREFEELAKAKMVGNVHLTDNLGFTDDHLAVGQGNAPVKEVVRILKKYGYDKALTAEPGADASVDQGDFWGLMKTWRHFGSPIYALSGPTRIGAPGGRGWTDVQNSYFGQDYKPYFVFGAYAPSNDWTLWSGIPLE